MTKSIRVIKVAAKDAKEATYKIAIKYTLDDFFPPVAEGEKLYTVKIVAEDEDT